MKHPIQKIALICGATMMVLAAPALSAPDRPGKGPGVAGGKGSGGASRSVRSNSSSSVNRSGGNTRRGGGNNVGNTVVVNGGGHGNNNGYHGGGGYYHDDNDFGEFVGKTMAITAGASIVAAVATSGNKTNNTTTNVNGQNCTQQISNGQAYVNCNGTWYQPMQNGTQTSYQPSGPPR